MPWGANIYDSFKHNILNQTSHQYKFSVYYDIDKYNETIFVLLKIHIFM